MDIHQAALILLIITLIITALGFKRFVYFISIGYAFSVAAMALVTAFLFREQMGLFAAAHLFLLAIWGVRLGLYIIRRDAQRSFQYQAQQTQEQYGRVNLSYRFVIWAGVSLLYVAMVLPALLHAAGKATGLAGLELVGLLVMAGGLVLEAVADRQKSDFKARFPRAFTNSGLYRWVRCPNYLGEMLFWAGSWIAGTAFATTWTAWIAALAGLVCIVLIMLGSTRRLEMAQDARYGELPEYQAYIRTVPVLIPWVPLFTLKNLKIYLG